MSSPLWVIATGRFAPAMPVHLSSHRRARRSRRRTAAADIRRSCLPFRYLRDAAARSRRTAFAVHSRFEVVRRDRRRWSLIEHACREEAVDLSEFVLETLRRHGGLVLSRGRHRSPAASSTRSILLLAAVSEHPPAATLKRLEHEYSLARELRSAWATQPVVLTEHQGRTTLVLEDRGRPRWTALGDGERATGSRLPVRAPDDRVRHVKMTIVTTLG